MRTPGSGRKPGTPNKKTQELVDRCEKAGVDPFDVLLGLARDSADEGTRMSAAKELCQYLYPKRKAIEHSGDTEGIHVIISDYTSKTEEAGKP